MLLHATARPEKEWPTAQWIALGNALGSCGYDLVVPYGNAAERVRSEAIASQVARASVPDRRPLGEAPSPRVVDAHHALPGVLGREQQGLGREVVLHRRMEVEVVLAEVREAGDLADDPVGPVHTHGAVERLNADYRASGVRLVDTTYAGSVARGHDFAGSLIVAPPSAAGSTWLRRFGDLSSGFASGWMRIRGARRRRTLDRGFVLSDHVDWPSLLSAVEGTGAEQVWVTHGTREPLVRWLTERGIEARAIASQWTGEQDTDPIDVAGEELTA